MRSVTIGILAGLMGAVAGCGGSGNPSVMDMAIGTCTPGAAMCLDGHTKQVCGADGKQSFAVACQTGQVCDSMSNDCKVDPAAACTDSDNTCMDGVTALHCTAAHAGFDVVACPANTTCRDAGVCAGKCVVGSGYCDQTTSTAYICTDGQSYTAMACATGQACVYTTGQSSGYNPWSDNPNPPDPNATAACKPADCIPDWREGCNTVCGDQTNAAAPNQQATTSTCTTTPDGYKWVVTTCTGGTSCVADTSYECNNNQVEMKCGTVCTPGTQTCTDALDYITCGDDGKWSVAPTACNTSNDDIRYTCINDPNYGGKIQCADFVCTNGGVGACDAAGLFYACDAMGHVSATGVACANGVCQATGNNNVGSLTQGQCTPQCNEGESRCVAASGQSSTYQTCGSNGLWGAATNCDNSVTCFEYTTTTSPILRKTICGGTCAPGEERCTDTNGNPVSSGTDQYTQTCGNDGNWGTAAGCAIGLCNQDPNHPSVVGCIAECVPGSTVCAGGDVTVPNTPYTGTDHQGTCDANGRLPTVPTACPANTYCRRNASGGSLGCVACVGGQNEFGLPDSRCGDAAGDAGNTDVIACLANSSGWDIPNELACAMPNPVCHDPSTNIQPPLGGGAPYCHRNNTAGGPGTQTWLQTNWNNPALTCNNNYWGQNWGDPTPCNVPGGTVPDCCSTFCYADQSPTGAYCGN